MNWFLVILAILGLIMGIAPGPIADNIKKCAEESRTNASERARSNINIWLWIFGVTIFAASAVIACQMAYLGEKEDKELESRIEVLEKQISQTDTTTVNMENL